MLGQLLVGIENQRDSTMALPICKSYLTSDFLRGATNLIFRPFVLHFPTEFEGFLTCSLSLIRFGNLNHQSAKYPPQLLVRLFML